MAEAGEQQWWPQVGQQQQKKKVMMSLEMVMLPSKSVVLLCFTEITQKSPVVTLPEIHKLPLQLS